MTKAEGDGSDAAQGAEDTGLDEGDGSGQPPADRPDDESPNTSEANQDDEASNIWVSDDFLDSERYDYVLGEFSHQSDLISSQINSLMQRSGLLFAFSSVLLVALFGFDDRGAGWTLAGASIFASCIFGSVAIIKGGMIGIGADIDEMDLERGDIRDLKMDLLNGLLDAIYRGKDTSFKMTYMLYAQMITVLAGAVVMAAVTVIRCSTGSKGRKPRGSAIQAQERSPGSQGSSSERARIQTITKTKGYSRAARTDSLPRRKMVGENETPPKQSKGR